MRMLLQKPSKENSSAIVEKIPQDSNHNPDILKLYNHLIEDCAFYECLASGYHILRFNQEFQNYKFTLKCRIADNAFNKCRNYPALTKNFPSIFSDLSLDDNGNPVITDTSFVDLIISQQNSPQIPAKNFLSKFAFLVGFYITLPTIIIISFIIWDNPIGAVKALLPFIIFILIVGIGIAYSLFLIKKKSSAIQINMDDK